MARVETESLTGRELARIFIAARLTEAQRVEDVLTRNVVDYVVNVEPFTGGIFSAFRPRNGAVFYVRSDQAAFCRIQLAAAGFGRGVVEGDSA